MSNVRYGLALLILACSGERLNVGDDPTPGGAGGAPGDSSSEVGGSAGSAFGGGTGGTAAGGSGGTAVGGAGASTPGEDWGVTADCDTDPEFEGLLGTWKGDLEDFFLQPVTTLTVVVNGVSSQGMCGTVTWGEGEPPPPATDPDAAYPSDAYFNGYGGSPAILPPVQGFPYSISQGAAREKTVRFATSIYEPWRSWCELQSSYPVPDGGYQCLSYAAQYATDYDTNTCTDGGETYSLFKCYACALTHTCQCDATRCDADPGPTTQFALTLSDAGDEMTGPYSGNGYTGALSYYLKHVE